LNAFRYNLQNKPTILTRSKFEIFKNPYTAYAAVCKSIAYIRNRFGTDNDQADGRTCTGSAKNAKRKRTFSAPICLRGHDRGKRIFAGQLPIDTNGRVSFSLLAAFVNRKTFSGIVRVGGRTSVLETRRSSAAVAFGRTERARAVRIYLFNATPVTNV